jgi:uncharacterized membrane protein
MARALKKWGYQLTETPMVKELIISGYPSQHSALLVQTALSRQQDELSLPFQDIAVVSRTDNGDITYLEPIMLTEKAPGTGSVLKILAEALFHEDDHKGTNQPTRQERLESIGIDSGNAARITKTILKSAAVVLVLVEKKSHAQTLAILSAFQGSVTRIRLHCDGMVDFDNVKNEVVER